MQRRKFTHQQVNYFVLGWLLVHPNGSNTKYDADFLARVENIFPKVVSHVLDGDPLDPSWTPLTISCAQAAAEVFGHETPVSTLPPGPIPPLRGSYPKPQSTTAEPLPEIHHDVVPHSEDKWSSSFTPL